MKSHPQITQMNTDKSINNYELEITNHKDLTTEQTKLTKSSINSSKSKNHNIPGSDKSPISNSQFVISNSTRRKPSGVEWLGDIPAHWEVKKLKGVSHIFGRIGFRGYTTDDLVDEGQGAITLSPSNMSNGVLDLENCTYISWDKYNESPEIKIEMGDVIIVKTGSTLGKTARVKEVPHPMTINPQLAIFKNIRCNADYLFRWVSSYYIQSQVDQSNTGGTIPTMTQLAIGNYPIPLPPLSEQKAIAEFLDQKTGRIDSLISKKKKLVELLKEKRGALISAVVTGKILTTKHTKGTKYSGVEWLGDIPKHWKVKKLRYVFSFCSGGTPSTEKLEYWDGDIPWVSSKDMKSFFIEDTEDHITEAAVKDSATNVISSNTLLVVMRSGILQHSIPACVIKRDMAINQDIKAFIQLQDLSATYYARFIAGFQKQLLTEWRKEGATVESLDMELIKNFSIPVPPLSEQEAIASYLDCETRKIDSLISKIEQTIEKLKEYRSALISAAVTGKIYLSKGDSNEYSS